jgi:hypothetical protein
MSVGTNQPTNQSAKGGDLRSAQVDVPWSVVAIPAFYRIAGLDNRLFILS